MPLPAIAYYGLTALGGWAIGQGFLYDWVFGKSDEWEDSDVFNSRMRQIHQGILDLNNLLAKCAAIHTPEQSANLTAWKGFVTNWSAYYKDVGTRYFDPGSAIVKEAKSYAETLAKWIDTYKSLCGPVPATMAPPDTKDKGSSWGSYLLWGLVIAGGAYVLASYVSKPSNPIRKYLP